MDKRVFEVRRTIETELIDGRMIFDKTEDGWILHLPDKSDWSEDMLVAALEKLRELKKQTDKQ